MIANMNHKNLKGRIMQTEEKKDNGTKSGCFEFGCCGPEDFRKMFEKKSGCFSGQNNAINFSAMREGMMAKMMEMCCGSTPTETKKHTESQKDPEGQSGPTEKE